MSKPRIGWIGIGRMGEAMVRRLARAGYPVTAYNRTRAKAEALAAEGVRVADAPAELAGAELVFTMLSGGDAVMEVLRGERGLLASGRGPGTMVDCSTMSVDASAAIRAVLERAGTQFLAAPVSGNPHVVAAGKAVIVASGPRAVFDGAAEALAAICPGVVHVGEGELARIAKLCHNLYVALVTESLAEITLLANRAGMRREAFLEFLNLSPMGSTFSRAKTPAFVKLDFSVTFTPRLMRRDVDLALELGRALEVPLPLGSVVRDQLQRLIGHGWSDADFSALLLLAAQSAGVKLTAEEDRPTGSDQR
jgi:3-hydroxyisobutyrate dehydrogenase-like beta-hydroxyacid dehydrogenase